jgi:hypothetical protein
MHGVYNVKMVMKLPFHYLSKEDLGP